MSDAADLKDRAPVCRARHGNASYENVLTYGTPQPTVDLSGRE